MRTTTRRIVKAALLALAAGGLVAVTNPMPSAAHDAAVALTSAVQLTAGAADFAREHIAAAAPRLA